MTSTNGIRMPPSIPENGLTWFNKYQRDNAINMPVLAISKPVQVPLQQSATRLRFRHPAVPIFHTYPAAGHSPSCLATPRKSFGLYIMQPAPPLRFGNSLHRTALVHFK